MAINYTDLFTLLGKVINACNDYEAQIPSAISNRESVIQEIADQDLDSLADGIASAVSGHISGLTAGCNYFGSLAGSIFSNYDLVTKHLPISGNSLSTVFPALFRDMVTNSQDIQRGLTTIGSI